MHNLAALYENQKIPQKASEFLVFPYRRIITLIKSGGLSEAFKPPLFKALKCTVIPLLEFSKKYRICFSNWTTIIALSMANRCWSVAIPQPWCRILAIAATLPCMATGRPIMALSTVSRPSLIMGLIAQLAVAVEALSTDP